MNKIDFKVLRFGVPKEIKDIEIIPLTIKAKDRFKSVYGFACVSVNVEKNNLLTFIKQLESEGFICEYF